MLLFGWIGPIVAMAFLGPSAGGADESRAPLPEPIVTQRTAFAIPFSIPPAGDPASAPVGVVLFYSRDRGENWNHHGQSPPEKGYFVFEADADGEYWFTIQSRDGAGNLWPRFTGVPGLRVRVDTTPPQVHVSAWRSDGGAVTARWRIVDANLPSGGVSLAYRAAEDPHWQDVALGSHHHSRSGDTTLGEVTWWPDPNAGDLEVRVEAVDRAANRSEATATVEAVGSAPPDRSAGAPSPDATAAVEPPAGRRYGQPWPAESEKDAEEAVAAEGTADVSTRPWPARPHPPLAHQYRPEEAAPRADVTWTSPHSEDVRAVNARLFELDFDVDSVDPASISHVELWATRDGGRTWRSISLHQKGRSPLLAKVDAEGTYGFRIVVHTRRGSGRKPQPDDPPDIWVRVDLTKPVARILSAEEGAGPEADHLIIQWTAEDEQLAEAPISLAYSPRPGGPWTVIAKDLPNTGRYAWPLPAKDFDTIYLRLEARDAAGNIGAFETSKPVVLDRAPPRVRVREVRPLGDTSNRSGPRRYIFR